MIQRIQSVWLFLAAVVVFSLFLFPYTQFADATGLGYALKVSGTFGNVDGQPMRLQPSWFLAGATILVGLLPLYTVFLFKDRKKQITFSYLAMLLVLLLGVWFYANMSRVLSAHALSFVPQYIGVGFFLLPIALILLFMAVSAIKRDEKLIRSADRLR